MAALTPADRFLIENEGKKGKCRIKSFFMYVCESRRPDKRKMGWLSSQLTLPRFACHASPLIHLDYIHTWRVSPLHIKIGFCLAEMRFPFP